MLHLVCDCGAALTVPPAAGGKSVICRACGVHRPVPDLGALGLAEEAGEAARSAPIRPDPVQPGPVQPPAHPVPSFGSDARLDIPGLERHAARMGILGGLAWAAGLLGAGGALLLSSRPLPERAFLAVAMVFGALLAWAGFSAARAAALAAVALAQRQREILQGMGR